jgi:hypothetical protein
MIFICTISIFVKCSFHYSSISYVDTQKAKPLELFDYVRSLASEIVKIRTSSTYYSKYCAIRIGIFTFILISNYWVFNKASPLVVKALEEIALALREAEEESNEMDAAALTTLNSWRRGTIFRWKCICSFLEVGCQWRQDCNSLVRSLYGQIFFERLNSPYYSGCRLGGFCYPFSNVQS